MKKKGSSVGGCLAGHTPNFFDVKKKMNVGRWHWECLKRRDCIALMFTIFKKLFRSSTDGGAVGRVGVVEMGDRRASESVGGGGAVEATSGAAGRGEVGLGGLSAEVVHLSLRAIVGRFSEDLASLVLREPDVTMMIALPLFLVAKQLPKGAVKISLASLHRLAPQGIFGPLTLGD